MSENKGLPMVKVCEMRPDVIRDAADTGSSDVGTKSRYIMLLAMFATMLPSNRCMVRCA